MSIIPGPPNLFLNGDEVSEDIRKWTVNDVYNFINSIPTCSEYAQVRFLILLCQLFLTPLCLFQSNIACFHSVDFQGPHD